MRGDFLLACRIMLPVSPLRCAVRVSAVIGATVVLLSMLAGCATGAASRSRSAVEAVPAADGVGLRQDGVPILFYRSRPEPGREPWRVNYVHPLHAVSGVTLTEDAPSDHLHQRGIYWAWRRILVDGVRVADGWVGDRLVLAVEVPRHRSHRDGSSEVLTSVVWRAPLGGVEAPIIEEKASIRAFPVRDGRRRIDFEIRLRALRSGVQLAGTDDDKGYGGISLRLAHAASLQFESKGRRLEASVGAVTTGDTVSFAWNPTPAPGWPAGVQVRCYIGGEPWRQWVLRREASMQNCAFPGREPVALPTSGPLVLRASVVL